MWGVFLLYGVYFAPARTGRGPRELLEALFGRYIGWSIWWILIPLWALSLYRELTWMFTFAIYEPLRRWEEANRVALDTQIAIYWPWIILTGLAGLAPLQQSTRWAGFLVKLSAAILLAAPFAYRREWPEVARYIDPPACCDDIWGMQSLVLWLAPALLFAGRFRDPEGRVVWPGIAGIVLPLVAGAAAAGFTVLGGMGMYGKVIAGSDGYLHAFATHGKPGGVKMILLTFTLLVAGRFCISLLCERLGAWRRWWLVFPLTAALAWNVRYLPSLLEWQLVATPFLALAGVICAGYLRRPDLVFDKAEQHLAAAVWVSAGAFGFVTYHNHFSVPFVTWLISFVLTWLALCARACLKVAVKPPLR